MSYLKQQMYVPQTSIQELVFQGLQFTDAKEG